MRDTAQSIQELADQIDHRIKYIKLTDTKDILKRELHKLEIEERLLENQVKTDNYITA